MIIIWRAPRPRVTPWLSPTLITTVGLLGKYALLLHVIAILIPSYRHGGRGRRRCRARPQTHDRNLSDKTQDFRFLNSIISTSDLAKSTSIPKCGGKDFGPNATKAQASALDFSRNAMHTALSHPRLHQVKTHVVTQYCLEGARYGGTCVRVDNAHGPHFRKMGKGDSKSRIWLLPEEALYLIVRGSLDIRQPDLPSVGDEGRNDIEGEGKVDDPFGRTTLEPLRRICNFIGKSGLTLGRYQVFVGLRRLGYTVVRAPTWEESYTGMSGHTTVPTTQ
jgi:tRNA-splicing endonuclease subunit Sen54